MLANRKELILEEDFKTLKDMFFGSVGTHSLSHLQFFEVEEIVAGEIWAFDATRGISR